MHKLDHIVAVIAEEASEITKEAMKIQRFGAKSINPLDTKPVTSEQKLFDELNDLLATIEMYLEERYHCHMSFTTLVDREKMEQKKAKVLTMMNIGRVE